LVKSLKIYGVHEITFLVPLKTSSTKLPHVHALIQTGHTTAQSVFLQSVWNTHT
jgi:hypothetical protein